MTLAHYNVIQYSVASILNPVPNVKNEHGFTLIELMIVVAIIAILAAIAIPAYQEWQHGGTQMGASGGTVADVPASSLVCVDGSGTETLREPAIPGERWFYEGGAYVTNDANGNPRVVRVTDNTRSCTIQ